MISVKACRKILGNKYREYTDKQIEQIRNWLYKLARMEKGKLKEQISNG